MSPWQCAIRGCGDVFPDAESALVHQTTDHDRHTCKVCSAVLPAGYFAIRHVFDEHGRAEYVRAYDANAADIRERERVRADIESAVDVDAVRGRLGVEDED
jgi:hypothetical protein